MTSAGPRVQQCLCPHWQLKAVASPSAWSSVHPSCAPRACRRLWRLYSGCRRDHQDAVLDGDPAGDNGNLACLGPSPDSDHEDGVDLGLHAILKIVVRLLIAIDAPRARKSPSATANRS